MRIWIGLAVTIAGMLLSVTARLERERVPPTFPRLAVGITALGLSTLATARAGLFWSWLSIVLSLVAIFCIVDVIRRTLRR